MSARAQVGDSTCACGDGVSEWEADITVGGDTHS
jgi:hypothetical protein